MGVPAPLVRGPRRPAPWLVLLAGLLLSGAPAAQFVAPEGSDFRNGSTFSDGRSY